MAQRIVYRLEDDLDNTEAAETIVFGLDSVSYEIDLSEKNAAKLRKTMSSWIEASRRSSNRRARAAQPKNDSSESTKARKWAIDNGLDVGPRGRLRSEVIDAYRTRATDKK